MNEINSLNDIRALVAFSTVNGEDAAGLMKFIQSDVRLEKIKENPKRSIFRMTDENGRMLYLKLFGKQKFPFNVIRFYAAKERIPDCKGASESIRADHQLSCMGDFEKRRRILCLRGASASGFRQAVFLPDRKI